MFGDSRVGTGWKKIIDIPLESRRIFELTWNFDLQFVSRETLSRVMSGLGMVGIPDWVSDYSAVSGAALAASVANGSRWRRADGTWDWHRLAPELATAVCLAMGIMAVGEYSHGLVDLKVLVGLGVLAGWLGPQPVADFVVARFFPKSGSK